MRRIRQCRDTWESSAITRSARAALAVALVIVGVVTGISVPATLYAQTTAPSATPATPAPKMTVGFSGELRSRSELDAPGGALNSDFYTLLRTRFGTQIDTDAGVHFVLQAQDSRVLGGEGHATAAAVQEFGVHQAYVELRGIWKGAPVALRAGRQEISIANERLVGVVNWSNLGRSFDGARFTVVNPGGAGDRWSATAFAATVEERGRHYGATGTAGKQSDHALFGVATTSTMPQDVHVDVTALYDVGANYRTFANANRATFDVRVRSAPERQLAAEIEGALQFGRQRYEPDSMTSSPQTVRAWLAGVRFGRFSAPKRRASVLVGADVLSGDATPGDATYRAFSTMYASNHALYGLLDVIGDPATTTRERGLADVFSMASLAFNPRVTGRVEAHRFTMTSGRGRDIGWETDVVVPVRVLPTSTVELGYSVFRTGDNASSIGLGTPGAFRNWAFVQLRVGF